MGRRDRFIEDLRAFAAIPSVSAEPRHAQDVVRAAGWLAERLAAAGLERARVVPTAGHPVVRAGWRGDSKRPTLLVYGHYDVQPVGQERRWRHDPFAPVVIGSRIYGRGTSDDKGQLLALVHALEVVLGHTGRLPVNVECLFDGEEEVGSPSLPAVLRADPELRHVAIVVVSDTRMPSPTQPALTVSQRGSLSLTCALRTAAEDLHAGTFGGAVTDAAQVLCRAVASLHEESGRVAVPRFYEAVRPLPAAVRSQLAAGAPEDAAVLRAARSSPTRGETGFSLHERTTIRPCLTVTGLSAGYNGPGLMTIVPARAEARLNIRLVPDQRPDVVARLLRHHLRGLVPEPIALRIGVGSSTPPLAVDTAHPAHAAARRALRRAFGKWPVLLASGGTIPALTMLRSDLGAECVLMGFALPDDRAHAPNEQAHIPTLLTGITAGVAFLEELGRLPARTTRARPVRA